MEEHERQHKSTELWKAKFSFKKLSLVHNYDAGGASVASVVSFMGKVFFHSLNSIPDVKFFDNLIGWMLAM